MKVLLAPLNWGLGHATRCVPVVRYLLEQGHEVVLASDGAAFHFLKDYFPHLRLLQAPSLDVRYAKGSCQVWAMLRQLPALMMHAWRDYHWLKRLVESEHIDCVVSDNRFGMYAHAVKSVYITHQLMIKMPSRLRWMEDIAHAAHQWVIKRYDECLVPDYAAPTGLSGDLSHAYPLPSHARFIGPLSRFMKMVLPLPDTSYDCVVLLSGPEPHRTILEQSLLAHYAQRTEKVLLLEGRPGREAKEKSNDKIDVRAHMSDEQLLPYLLGAKHIVCRSGYSSIMDLAVLGLLNKATLIPTPGQTEQEYLAVLHSKKNISITC